MEMEKRFLDLSSGIESLSGKSAELVMRSRELLERALGYEEKGSIFQDAIKLVEGPLVFNSECHQIVEDLIDSLGIMSGRVDKLDSFRQKLNRSTAPLKLLQIMFRIESATCAPEVQALFSSISVEIARLQLRMATMIAKEFEAIENTQVTLNGVMLRLRGIHSQQIAVATRRTDIESSISHSQEQAELNRTRDVRLIGVSEGIAANVAHVVTALQYQDILKQRLEHTLQGFSDMAEKMTEAGSGVTPELMSFLRDTSLVESFQLEEVEEILNREIENIHRSLAGISTEIGDLSEDCILLKDIESASVTSDGMVQVLLDAISETHGFSESTYAQTDEICRALEPISGMVGSLTESILEVSVQIRLIALNAQIQAVRAGRGTGLEVLSARTCGISEEMADIVTDISTELTAMKDSLRGGLETMERTRRRTLEFTELLKDHGGRHTRELHEFRDRAFAGLLRIQDLVAEIQADSMRLSGALDLRADFLEAAGTARTELRALADSLAAHSAAGEPHALVEERRRLYTAAAQHATYERALGRGEPTAEERPDAVAVEGSVEFF